MFLPILEYCLCASWDGGYFRVVVLATLFGFGINLFGCQVRADGRAMVPVSCGDSLPSLNSTGSAFLIQLVSGLLVGHGACLRLGIQVVLPGLFHLLCGLLALIL